MEGTCDAACALYRKKGRRYCRKSNASAGSACIDLLCGVYARRPYQSNIPLHETMNMLQIEKCISWCTTLLAVLRILFKPGSQQRTGCKRWERRRNCRSTLVSGTLMRFASVVRKGSHSYTSLHASVEVHRHLRDR